MHEAEALEVLPDAPGAAEGVLKEHPETRRRIARVLELAEGFETAYGLELLASVYWISRDDPEAARDAERAVEGVQSWTPRKGRMFTADHIRAAWTALRDHGWIHAPTTV